MNFSRKQETPGPESIRWQHQPRFISGTAGRNSTRFVKMTSLAGVSSGPFQPSLAASMWISPGCFVDCTMTCASPLKSERLGSLSLCWQLGSPLPTPMSAPAPETLKPTRLSAVGTGRPSLSRASTFRTATSSPSALICVSIRSHPDGDRRAGGFALLRQHHLPAFRCARLDCAWLVLAFHSTWPRCGTFWLPMLLPLTNSSTSSRLV